jgi:DNA-binding transcriptional regulator YiaG
MTTTTEVCDCREPAADYLFSEFGTSNVPASSEAQSWAPASKAGASLLLTGIVMFGGLPGTSIGGQLGSIAPFVTVARTDRGELAPVIAPKPEPVSARAVGNAESRTDSEEVTWIKRHSGLTWDQLGKIFGVSRRAVHMWVNGGRLNESNARRVRSFSAIIRDVESEIPQPTPEMVRARLLQVESDGLSIIDRLRRERSTGPTYGAPFGPERLVDTIREPLRTQVGEVGH